MGKRRGGLRISHVHKIGCCCFCCLSSYYCCCMLAARVPSKSNKRSHTKELCMWPAIPPSHFFFAFAARYEASKPSSSSKLQLRTNAKEHQASLYITATITAPSKALQKQPKQEEKPKILMTTWLCKKTFQRMVPRLFKKSEKNCSSKDLSSLNLKQPYFMKCVHNSVQVLLNFSLWYNLL